MRKLLDEKLARFEELERQMTIPEVLANSAKIASLAREHGSIAKLAMKYRRFKQLVDEIRETAELAHSPDPELRQLAEESIPPLKEERERLWEELLDMT